MPNEASLSEIPVLTFRLRKLFHIGCVVAYPLNLS